MPGNARIAEALSAPEPGHRWTAEELTAVKLVTDQISGAVSYFAADLLYTGTVQTASQIWALDQVIDAVRYTALEYGWQRLGPRRLATDGPVALRGAGIGRLAGRERHDRPSLARWSASALLGCGATWRRYGPAASKPGATFTGRVELAGKQVALPEGTWTLAGRGFARSPSWTPMPTAPSRP